MIRSVLAVIVAAVTYALCAAPEASAFRAGCAGTRHMPAIAYDATDCGGYAATDCAGGVVVSSEPVYVETIEPAVVTSCVVCGSDPVVCAYHDTRYRAFNGHGWYAGKGLRAVRANHLRRAADRAIFPGRRARLAARAECVGCRL